ncbi:unnamed protein product [Closterium sp. Yama58-4]|nr:unnamed protein product [Closterium sp. Yama58-4]
MKPCARLSGLCGLAALVAFFHQLPRDPRRRHPLCAQVNCGEAACVGDTDLPGPLCVCKDGLHWAQDKTCVADLCTKLDCGEATCTKDPYVDFATCECKQGFEFDDDSKTCVDMCAGVECGSEASCDADSGAHCVCNKKGYWLQLEDMTCFAPVVRTSVVFQQGGLAGPRWFFLPQRPEQSIGAIACGSRFFLKGDARITVVWNASKPVSYQDYVPGNAMCKRLLFYSDEECKEKVDFTIARPVKKGSSYPITRRAVNGIAKPWQSVGCEITMCENDCGTAACVVKEGQWQCQCPEGLVFNEAKKLCLDPSLPRRAGGQAKKGRP